MFFHALANMTQQDWLLLGVGLLCIGPLAINVGYFIWWCSVQPSKQVRLQNENYRKRCPDCGNVDKERHPFCRRCGAYVQFPSNV